MYGRIIGVVAVVAIGAALAMGCGGEDEASADVTKAEFIEEAEAICAERKKDWDTEVAAFTKQTEAQGQANFKKRSDAFFSASLLPLLEEELTALEELSVPEAEEAKVDKMLESRSRAIKALEDEGTEALLGESFKDFEKEATAYGLNCPPLL